MDLRHRRHRGDYQEVRRQRIPKVGHQDFTARPLARFQYLVRIHIYYVYYIQIYYQFTSTILFFFLTDNIIVNLIHSCVCLTSHFWHRNWSEEGNISEAERPETATCKIMYIVSQIFFILFREMDDD